MTVVATKTQIAPDILLTEKLTQVLLLVLEKVRKYEELGRLDKAHTIVSYINSILLIVKHWYYSDVAFKELPICFELRIECVLKELKAKLHLLPRDLWVDISSLLLQRGHVPIGIDEMEIIGTTKDNPLTDFQITT